MELAFFVSFRICDADACDGTGGLGREWGISGDGGFEGLLSNLSAAVHARVSSAHAIAGVMWGASLMMTPSC